MKISVKNMILVALFAAITAVCSQIAIPVPFSPVPFTLQVMAVCLAGGILGRKLGALSLIVYLLLGAIGIPVFAQFSRGLSVLAGPTGGFLLSFPIATYVIGLVTERKISFSTSVFAMFVGLIIIYVFGLVQFKYVTALGWQQSFSLAAALYIIPDIVKIVITSVLVVSINRALEKTNLKPTVERLL